MYKIAIMGQANTGKNTLSRIIVRQLRNTNYHHKNVGQRRWLTAKQLAFADPIKKMIQDMFPKIPKKHLFGSSKFRSEVIPGAFKDGVPLTIRQLLIDLGTEVGRKYKPDVWLDNFDYRFEQWKYRSIVIVTDVRFRNEFEHLRKKGFYMIRLYRNTGQPTIQHISETEQQEIKDEEFDYVIHNDRSLKELKLEVAKNIIPNLIDD
jgi:GTPase SAR1 family protein